MKLNTKIFKLFVPIFIVALAMTSCSKENDLQTDDMEALDYVVIANENYEGQTLFAGQTIDIGKVNVAVVNDAIEVTYDIMAADWELTEAQLWLGRVKEEMPQTRNGNPKIGNFPFNAGDITGATSWTFVKPLSELGITNTNTCEDFTVFFAAHASVRRVDANGNVVQTETAWGDGYRLVDRGSWATGFQIDFKCINEDVTGGPSESCETAFAFGGAANCFLSIDEDGDGNGDFNRWGWYIGPLSQGTTTYDIYAGAGQCDLTKGTNVGTLTVNYSGSTATVTYNMSGPYVMDETHVYVGSEILPRKNGDFTVAPGQYGNIKDLTTATTDSYTITGLSGDIYVIAHAVVCGF